MNIRTRRLRRDYEKVLGELGGNEFISIQVVSGDPPSHYRVTYRLKGLMWNETASAAVPADEHIVEISLPLGYPKQAPRCTMRTPIWHPNIGDYVCIGDYWSAGVTLVDIIAHIGDMIQYKTYNIKSPVNKAAAVWAEHNERSFPIGNQVIALLESDSPASPAVEITLSRDEFEIDLGPLRDRE